MHWANFVISVEKILRIVISPEIVKEVTQKLREYQNYPASYFTRKESSLNGTILMALNMLNGELLDEKLERVLLVLRSNLEDESGNE